MECKHHQDRGKNNKIPRGGKYYFQFVEVWTPWEADSETKISMLEFYQGVLLELTILGKSKKRRLGRDDGC